MPTGKAAKSSAKSAAPERSLRQFLDEIEKNYPNDIVHVTKPVEPAKYEVTAILKHLENEAKFPIVMWDKAKNVKGQLGKTRLVSNVFASRERCAIAMGLKPEDAAMPLSLEYAKRLTQPLAPVVLSKREAPVKQVCNVGKAADLSNYPIVRHHHMDPAPYIDMTPVMKHPTENFYNIAFLRNMYKEPRKLGIHMSPRHNWQIFRYHEQQGKPTPVIIVVGHHPSFYLGALNVEPYGKDDYSVIGGIMGSPLRVVPSETWGDKFMVPADAEMIIEGEMPANTKEIEGPFGEFTGYYGPQRIRPIINVTAITHRTDAILQHAFVGHRDNWFLGGIPKEGTVYNVLKGIVPTVKAVHLPPSGSCRFNCYISIDKRVDGETKQAALATFGTVDFIKNIIVVDGDIDPFNEQEVMFAVATRTQARESVDIIKNVKGNTLDPSQEHDIMTDKLLIDATKPVNKAFSARVRVPDAALAKFPLKSYIDQKRLNQLPSYPDSRRSV